MIAWVTKMVSLSCHNRMRISKRNVNEYKASWAEQHCNNVREVLGAPDRGATQDKCYHTKVPISMWQSDQNLCT